MLICLLRGLDGNELPKKIKKQSSKENYAFIGRGQN